MTASSLPDSVTANIGWSIQAAILDERFRGFSDVAPMMFQSPQLRDLAQTYGVSCVEVCTGDIQFSEIREGTESGPDGRGVIAALGLNMERESALGHQL